MTKTMLLIGFVVLPFTVSAETLKDKENGKKEDALMQTALSEVNSYCGSSIKAVGDWASFQGKLADGGTRIGAYCGQALAGIKGVCTGGDESKDAVRKGITTFRCVAGDHAVKLEGKVVIYSTNLGDKTAGVDQKVREYLREKL